MTRRSYDEMQMSAAIVSLHSDACRNHVEDIRNGALNEYQRVKKHKQNELNARRLNEQTANTPTKNGRPVLTKTQKKKDDNHASAVASRNKQDYMLQRFEETLRKKIADAIILSTGYSYSQAKIIALNKIIAERDADIRSLNQELSMYRTIHPPTEEQQASFRNHHNNNHALLSVELAATMEEIISTEVPPFDVAAHKLASNNPHALVAQYSPRTLEVFGMSNNHNPAA